MDLDSVRSIIIVVITAITITPDSLPSSSFVMTVSAILIRIIDHIHHHHHQRLLLPSRVDTHPFSPAASELHKETQQVCSGEGVITVPLHPLH